MLPTLTAPVGGSAILFPRRLAAAVAQREAGGLPSLPSAHARWYFGGALVVWTDPSGLTARLHERVRDGEKIVRLADRFLDCGDWSDVISQVARVADHRDMLELVAFGERYPEMQAFRKMIDRIARGRPVRRYRRSLDSEAKVHAYFRYFLALIDSIRTHGYRSRGQFGAARTPAALGVRGRFAFRQREIGVAIDADGRLLRFLGGRHRTAIAQALALPVVPVEIRLVHADWLAGEVRRAGLPPGEALRRWAERQSAGGAATTPRPSDLQFDAHTP
jgi:hypothetical protein